MSNFSERKQCVKYKRIKSDILSTNYGVAQGSIVGLIVHIIYMIDIIESTKALKFVMHADDPSVYNSDKSIIINNMQIVNTE